MDEDMKLEITQDKILDILMHAATRDDIAQQSSETKLEFNTMRSEFTGLRSEFGGLREEFNRLRNDVNQLRIDLNALSKKLDTKFNQLTLFIVASILTPIFLHVFQI